MNTLSIFKPGTFTDMSGVAHTFSEADLRACAISYDPKRHDAPIVVGHPKSNGPAYGWTQSLTFEDGFLKAITRDVSAKFSEWVAAKHYKKISASLYTPNSPNNPVPGVYYLRHIGFLGAMPPAIKGLPDAEFCGYDSALISIEFSEPMTKQSPPKDPEKIAVLALSLQEEMKQYGETISCSDAVSLVNSGFMSIGSVDFAEQLGCKEIGPILLTKLMRAGKVKSAR